MSKQESFVLKINFTMSAYDDEQFKIGKKHERSFRFRPKC